MAMAIPLFFRISSQEVPEQLLLLAKCFVFVVF
jgi:hypothetical protein